MSTNTKAQTQDWGTEVVFVAGADILRPSLPPDHLPDKSAKPLDSDEIRDMCQVSCAVGRHGGNAAGVAAGPVQCKIGRG